MSYRNILNPNNPLVKRLSSRGIWRTHVIYGQEEVKMIKQYLKVLDHHKPNLAYDKKEELSEKMIIYGVTHQGKTTFSEPKMHYAKVGGLLTLLNPFFYLTLAEGEPLFVLYLATLGSGMFIFSMSKKMEYLRKREEVSDYVTLDQALTNLKD